MISLSANIVTIVGAGKAVITAHQIGNSTYAAASANRTVTVEKAPQKIAKFSLIPSQTITSPPFAIPQPISTSGLPVKVSLKSGPATLSDDIVTLTGKTGTVVLMAVCDGDANHRAAPDITTRFVIKAR